jgi:tetratricopeptide (TPR) repeat protein
MTSRMMKRLSPFLLISFCLLPAATVAPLTLVGQDSSAPASSRKSQESTPLQTRKQKLANPLNELLDEAQRDITEKNFTAAIEPLQKFIAQQPDFAYAHFQLAYVYTALQKPPEARAEYEKTIALDPKMSEAYLNLGILFLDIDPSVSIPNLRKAIELLPSQSRPRYLLGVAQERAGDYTAAADSFEGAHRLDPHDLEPVVHLAKLYLRLKRPADAETKFRSALEQRPGDAQALLGIAESLDAQQKPAAVEAYRAFLAAQPTDSVARSRYVHLLIALQQYDAALGELDRADSAGQPDINTLRMRADILIAQKKWDDSIATLNKAIALAPNDAELHGGLGRIYMQKRDFANSAKELKTAMQLDAKNLTYLKDLGTSYYLAGNCPSTLAVLDLVAKSETPGAGPWFIRALCYDKLNQPKPALDAYQKFLDLDRGKNADQVWQAQERSKVLRKMLEHKR